MIERPEYLNKLLEFRDKQLIKIITGVRRCGKSTLFELYQAKLAKLGVTKKQIQSINFEDPAYLELLDWKKLYSHITGKLVQNRKNYIFLDEIQNVPDFQKAADGLFIRKNVDLYLTGSNSKMLSGTWATLLSGRYVEIHLFPLSFKEYAAYCSPRPGTPRGDFETFDRLYGRYTGYSGFPYAVQLEDSLIREYLSGIYSTIVLKDVAENKNLRDISRLESVIRFMADTIGSETSVHNIAKTMTSDGRKIDTHAVETYLDALLDSYILYRAGRYDVKGKKHLKTLTKYYLVDVGLRYFLLGGRKRDLGHILENVVYLELRRRYRQVFIGKVDDKEVDFVAEGDNGVDYYQVSDTVRDRNTLDRELAPLEAIRDHNPKFLLTRDYEPPSSHNGIRQLNVLDWLLG
ncbi:MAG: ATP-binding protein [Treponema sp.]|jgi:predicted AAA+ superfamily ATPase|nr:ATP-binding protein [Treponema sp.]